MGNIGGSSKKLATPPRLGRGSSITLGQSQTTRKLTALVGERSREINPAGDGERG